MRRLALALALAVSGLVAVPPGPAAAAPESDIPGIPLPGPVVSGRLGGTIYDVVYSLTLPKGYVLVASLVGSVGTDFDLYLYSAAATSVTSQTGLLRKSVGPTSSESLTYAAAGDSTLYLDLNGASDVQGDYILTVQIVPDPTPPVARLRLNGGAQATSSATVNVKVDGFDDISGIAEAALSADGTTWGDWFPAPLDSSWTFAAITDGTQALWARVRNGVGQVSPAVRATIVLDTRAPGVTRIAPARDTTVSALRPPISVTFDEPIAPTSWTDALLLQGPSGERVPGAYTYSVTTRTGTFTPSTDLGLGLLYVATVTGVRDIAGNPIDAVASWTIKRLSPASLTLTGRPLVVTYGARVALSGTASPAEGTPVVLRTRPPDSTTWTDIDVATSAAGRYAFSVLPTATGLYRTIVPPTETLARAASAAVTITVRRAIAVDGGSASTLRRGKAGSAIPVTARITPGDRGVGVTFRLYRWNATRKRWLLSSTRTTRTTSGGVATTSWTPASGLWAWRVTVAGTTALATNTTTYVRWSIAR
ncbi:MAG: hypothetical protein RL338_527 [Chloroflexota bacterium]